MAEYINRNELVENLDRFAPEHLTPLIRTLIEKQPTADVVEVKDCNLCVFNSRHATQYPCSHCKNCYTDKFKPIE